jgi:hypothetical protein
MISGKLIDKTFDYFKKSKSNNDTKNIIVSPGIPILYFGNLEDYEKSKIKIITVGKNPSDKEFRLKKNETYSFARFPKWNEKKQNLMEALNSYFEERPYKSWFNCYEPVLNGLSASYYAGKNMANISLHTDLCSPLATYPTWSDLSNAQISFLMNEGVIIWQELVEELQPDIMLVSFAKSCNFFEKYICSDEGEHLLSFNEKLNGEPRKKPYVVMKNKYILKSGKTVMVVFGYQEGNKPFDTLASDQRKKIGELICLQ